MEQAMASHSSSLAWKIPWMEERGRMQSMGWLGVRHDWVTSLSLSCTGEGNGNPLQCSCLENPRDGRAWWAAIYGVAQSQTRLKWLSSSSRCTTMWISYIYIKHTHIFEHLRKLWEMVKERETQRAAARGIPKSQTWLSNWTILYTHTHTC